jgi:hypothetical protein
VPALRKEGALIDFADDAVLAAMTLEERTAYARLVSSLVGGESLRDFIGRLTPHRPAPPHVSPIIRAMELARLRPIKVCISLPPRHVKTETVMNALAWWMKLTTTDTNAYASYNQEQAESKSRIIRERAISAGVQLKGDSANVSEWRTTAAAAFWRGRGSPERASRGSWSSTTCSGTPRTRTRGSSARRSGSGSGPWP